MAPLLLHKKPFSRITRRSILEVLIFLAATVAVPNTSGGQEIFSDGFESGDTTRWSFQIPPAEAVDGTYQFAVYDSLAYASGGNLVITDGTVEAVNGTYFNFDKVDGQGNAECTLILRWGINLASTVVEDFASGVEFTDSYPGGGTMTWTLAFSINENVCFSGTLAAVGASFTGVDSGCNGTFPTFNIEGGKRNPSTQ